MMFMHYATKNTKEIVTMNFWFASQNTSYATPNLLIIIYWRTKETYIRWITINRKYFLWSTSQTPMFRIHNDRFWKLYSLLWLSVVEKLSVSLNICPSSFASGCSSKFSLQKSEEKNIFKNYLLKKIYIWRKKNSSAITRRS